MQAPPELQSNHPAHLRRTSEAGGAAGIGGGAGATGGTASAAAFELKGVVAPLTVLRLRSTDVRLIERQLRVRIAEMPQFFLHAPVLLDLGALGPMARALDFFGMAAGLRACHMVPVAITNASDEIRGSAAEAGFGFVAPPSARLAGRGGAGEAHGAAGAGASGSTTPAPELDGRAAAGAAASPRAGSGGAGGHGAAPGATPSATPMASGGVSSASTQVRAAPPRPHRPPLVIRQPVRSGQIIYAERNDVVVLAPVNPGAEVIADGNVHIYAPLRGRVVAGAQGFTEARIFCQRLEAELVAIAGAYMLADDIPAEYRGKPAQVYLEDGHCRVAAL